VFRHVDDAGRECAYYDSTLVFPFDAVDPRRDSGGVYVVDMADPSAPQVVEQLVTPAMVSPHESLVLNSERGILAAVLGNPTVYPGVVDLYDVNADCRSPQLLSSSPVGFLGHESGFSPDGMTLYAASLFTGTIAAIDVSDPTAPQLLTVLDHSSHGLTTNEDGTRAYLAALTGAGPEGQDGGLVILDTSEIQERVLNPQVSVVSTLTWPGASIAQVAIPVTIGGTPYLVQIDEFAGHPLPRGGQDPAAPVGAGRLIDISDETDPEVVSLMRLEVHDPEARAGESATDPGAEFPGRGYAGHYCSVPRSVDPEIVACSMIASGLRVFDIRDPLAPREVAYYNAPGEPVAIDPYDQEHGAAYAMSAPAYAPERNEVWYADVASGFHALRLTNGAWNSDAAQPTPDPTSSPSPSPTPSASPTASPTASPSPSPTPSPAAPVANPNLPATGAPWAGVGLLAALAALALGRGRAR
jgi:hypothetical protein